MSAEAVMDSEDDLLDTYQTLQWMRNDMVFWTENHQCIRLQYREDNITFLRCKDYYTRKIYNDYQTLIKDLSSKNQKIYIEWVQHTGKYLYFDLLSIAKKVKAVTFDTKILKYDANNKNCIKPAFDESASPTDVLTNEDIVLLSPIRSILMKFTEMGTFHQHKLYLGGLPEIDFVKQCNVKYLFNCCAMSNDAEITNIETVKEYIFDVAGWTVGRIDESDDDEDTDNDDDEYEQKSHQIEDLQLAYLDKKIDFIDDLLHKGNVFIHCLAGAHRSPFITGCYAYKYGKMNGKTSKEIYKWLVETRSIVQPLGYDKWMEKYHKYLANRNKK